MRKDEMVKKIKCAAIMVVCLVIGLFPLGIRANEFMKETYIRTEYVEYLTEVCKEKHLSVELTEAIIESESAGQATVVSSAGCVGLMQMSPKNEFSQGRNLYNYRDNIDAGTDYLIYLFEKFEDVSVVLTAYNTGEYSNATKNSINYGTVGPYATKILKRAEELEKVHNK